jgi:hypothetical protein
MKNQADYSQYECPYAHLDKECGHELHGPEGYQDTYGVWCACGFRGPVFYLDPEQLGLKRRSNGVANNEFKATERIDGTPDKDW